jgi:transposase
MSHSSIKEQIEKLKLESNKFLSSDETPSDVKFFINSLMSILEIIVVVLLTKKVRRNSSNSGLAPSQNFGSNGNRNHPTTSKTSIEGTQLPNVENVVEETNIKLSTCKCCGEDLRYIKVKSHETRVVKDIIYKVVEKRLHAEVKECPSCHKTMKASFPLGVDGEIQYGDGVKILIINFLMVQMVSLQRTAEFLNGILGSVVSQAVMLKYILQMYHALDLWEAEQIDFLKNSTSLYIDETSVRINGKNYWFHTYGHKHTTLQFLSKFRGREAIEEIGILPEYKGVAVHDRYMSYLSYKNVLHALCGSHLLRDLKYIEELTKHSWATKMKKLLCETAETIYDRQKTRVLTTKERKDLSKKYQKILKLAEKEMPALAEKNGNRGRIKRTEEQNLYFVFKNYEKEVLRFTEDKNVDFTNNRAESDLRMTKVKQKVSGGFRTEEMARAFCRISGYLKSMRYQGYSAFEAISFALKGEIPKVRCE